MLLPYIKMEDTYSYKGWLNSDSFLKRAFAVYGYGFVPIPIMIILTLTLGIIVQLFLTIIGKG